MKVDLRHLTSDTLLAALTEMASLEELHILREPRGAGRPGSADPQFLVRLTASAPVLCPHLRCLELVRFSAVSDDTILRFVQSRTGTGRELLLKHVVQLERMAATLDRRMQFDIRPQLSGAIADGALLLNIMYSTRPAPALRASSCCSSEGMKPISRISQT
ncbi:hypothetical protein K438DRAFT_1959872 [Mycena galopus ATCC 62051]|nr:hypothetical protein K438DRAFT_1959872 [Mycena galopus ATCC 62051]